MSAPSMNGGEGAEPPSNHCQGLSTLGCRPLYALQHASSAEIDCTARKTCPGTAQHIATRDERPLPAPGET